MYPVVHLEDELYATSSTSSSSKTLWWFWGCIRRPPGHLSGGNFEKLNKKKLVKFFFFCFFFDFDFFWISNFFPRSLLLHHIQKHFEGVDKVDGVPLDTFFGAISKIILSDFFHLFLSFLNFVLKFFYFLKNECNK